MEYSHFFLPQIDLKFRHLSSFDTIIKIHASVNGSRVLEQIHPPPPPSLVQCKANNQCEEALLYARLF